ncbi:unnamed protein product [Fusarium graminearum]|nr:unnamed protein product [Fusarium graminearum]
MLNVLPGRGSTVGLPVADDIGLSIKSQELYGDDPVGSEMHLAAWHAAQWRFLKGLAGDNIKDLGFLPGIIIEGHEWKFVATTWKKGKTKLFSSLSLGSTTTELGVYRIFASLKVLGKWVMLFFWPWYREYCLKLVKSRS